MLGGRLPLKQRPSLKDMNLEYEYRKGSGWVPLLKTPALNIEGYRITLENRIPNIGERFWSDGFDLESTMETFKRYWSSCPETAGAIWDSHYEQKFPCVEGKGYKLVVIKVEKL